MQWMTAGYGVVHSEMPSDELMKKGGRMEGFQLWVNLPAKVSLLILYGVFFQISRFKDYIMLYGDNCYRIVV